MSFIHPTAIVDKNAKIGNDIFIGAYCIIGADVQIGDGTKIEGHVVIDGHTTIGLNNKISPFASIGQPPQDLKYKGEPTRVVVGDNNLIREYVTINCGTVNGHGVTTIGNNNMLMAYSHVAHDCVVGNNVVLANGASLAGHVALEDYVVLGGFTGVTQFNRIGKHAFIGAYSLIRLDFPPYFTGKGMDNFNVQSVNAIGLSRRGFSEEAIRKIKNAYKLLYVKKGVVFEDVMNELREEAKNSDEILYLVKFIETSKNGIIR
ncbi:MAG: acyl-ACP--UDP-N-acetylglucosamine O-acyltransferase [Proteobacteria bacterium]|nr:acyl-ACP--UDP-N-acetylglucosamine O-acyltransferase [Pseudomonadota bacterium]